MIAMKEEEDFDLTPPDATATGNPGNPEESLEPWMGIIERRLDMVDTGELFGDPRSIRGILFYPGTSMGQHQCPRIADHHFNMVLVRHDSVPL